MATVFDYLRQFPDLCMQLVQTSSLPLNSGYDRSTAPCYAFGDVPFGGTPGVAKSRPSYRWKLGDGTYDFTQAKGGFGVQGTAGTAMQEYVCQVMAADQATVWQEQQLLLQAFRRFASNPPISEISWAPIHDGAVDKNYRYGVELRVVAPVEVLPDMTGITEATIAVVTASLASGSIAYHDGVPTFVTGSQHVDVVVSGSV